MWKIITTSRFILPLFCSAIAIKPEIPPIIATAHKMSTTTNGANSEKRPRIEGQRQTIGTHGGTFHCDEVLACFMLKQLPEYADAKILRTRNINELREKCDIIVDVGSEFDHEKKWYDHHQISFQDTLSSLRPELGDAFGKIRLSSAGLVYCYYGERIIDEILKKQANITLTPSNLQLVFVQMYRNFISEIDAVDNGVPMCPNGVEPLYTISTGLSSRVAKLNLSWEEEGSSINIDERFAEAMTYVGKEFVDNVVAIGGSWIKAREYVREALVTAKNVYESGEILLLSRFCPWKQHLVELEKEYDVVDVAKLVIFADGNAGSWRVAGVPVNPNSYLGRKFLPKPWRGLKDEELSQVAEIEDLVFVHHTGFIGGAKTKEAAIKMAIKSVEWKE